MNIVLVIAAILIVFLVFTWSMKVIRATIGTAIAIVLLILVLQVVFGITPLQVWQPIFQGVQTVWRTVTGGR